MSAIETGSTERISQCLPPLSMTLASIMTSSWRVRWVTSSGLLNASRLTSASHCCFPPTCARRQVLSMRASSLIYA